MSKGTIYLGDDRFNAEWLKSVTEDYAVMCLKSSHSVGQIRNASKQAKGLTKPKYDSSKPPVKSKPKKQKPEKD